MTCSEATLREADRIISQVYAMLDEAYLRREIDEPVDQALDEFQTDSGSAFSHEDLHTAIAGFVRALAERPTLGMGNSHQHRARDEAVALLEMVYQGTHGDGYDAARFDATDPTQPGLPLVLARIAEGLKARHRRQYTRWVAARYVESACWATRCAMAAVLMDRCREWLPPEVVECTPPQLADHVFRLLLVHLDTDEQSRSLSLDLFGAGPEIAPQNAPHVQTRRDGPSGPRPPRSPGSMTQAEGEHGRAAENQNDLSEAGDIPSMLQWFDTRVWDLRSSHRPSAAGQGTSH